MKTKPNLFLPMDRPPNRGPFLASVTTLSIMLLGFATCNSHAQTTGFNQVGAGPWDYDNTANWVGGTVNGIWDPTLPLTAAQTVSFDSNLVLGTGLGFNYTGNFDLTLRSFGTVNQTITLGGDIIVAPVSNRTITIGSATANNGLNVNLGGVNRTFTLTGAKALNFLNTLSNGDITISGNSTTAAGGTVKFAGASGAAASSNIDVINNATLQFDSSTSGVTGTTRAQSVTLKSGGKLLVSGNNGVNSEDTISGNLVIDGSAVHPKVSTNSVPNVTVTPGTKNSLLSFGNLQRVSNAVVLFRGTNLGANTIASATASSGNIQITGTAPTLVGGGGAAGSTTISIIPWAVGGTSSSDGGTTFATYTAANGIRPLNTATEFATAFGGSATDNVRLTATTDTSIASDTTVNSLILSGQGGSISGPGTLTVTSGAVVMTRTTGTTSPINANLNFGTAEGVIGYTRGDVVSGTIAGSGGLTVYGMRSDEVLTFSNAGSTYTGDTTVLANAQVFTGFLPSGSRTGNVYVYGNLQLNVGGYNGTINGLFGNGVVAYGNSSVASIAIGDNDVTSTFTGTIAGNTNLNVSKIGSGTLTLTGDNTNAKVMSILGGTLSVTKLADGGVASGIGSSVSTAANLVINGGTLKYTGAATSTDRLFQVGQTTTSGTATVDASGTGAVNFTNTGTITYGTAGSTSVSQTRNLTLAGTNTGNNTLAAIIGNNGAATNGNSAVSVTKSGTGTWTLSGTNTYTGTTSITSGKLVINGNSSTATGNVSVAAGATLAGGGTVGGATTLNGILAPGNSIGTLTINNDVTWNGVGTAGSTTDWQFELGLANASDLLDITGSGSDFLKGTGGIFRFDFLGGTNTGTYKLVDWADVNYTTFAFTDFSYTNLGGGNTGTFSITGSQLNFTVVPEPNAAALIGGFGAIILLRRRRHA